MKNVIIGTAGHIDHGKTRLIKALTGRRTDTLDEEIKRGISINLGFTYFDLPSGKRAGIIDVPGHERFIKNMLAGAAGVDIVLFVIAANEGIKPQTVEHIDILSFLNMEKAVIVLTKADLADEIMIEIVSDDIREKIKGTIFENSEIIATDSVSMLGIDKLTKKIDELANEIKPKNEKAPARLNIDRVFTVKGFGTVVTGTLMEGTINLDDEMSIYPQNIKTKIRSLQVHEENVTTAYAGQRTAINLTNIKATEISRGDVLAKTDSIKDTLYLDVKITTIKHSGRILNFWERIRLYIGSKEIFARLIPLDKDTIEPGESAFCQLRLEEPVAAKKDDKFVIRYYSPMETVGGGIVLDPNPEKHGKSKPDILEQLKLKENGDISEVVESFIKADGEKYTSLKDIINYMSSSEDLVRNIITTLVADAVIVNLNNAYFHIDTINNFKDKVLEIISEYHNSFPLRVGITKEELRSKLKSNFKNKELDILLKQMMDENLIKGIGTNKFAVYTFSIKFNVKQEKIKQEIELTLKNAKFSPPPIQEILGGRKDYEEVFESMLQIEVVKVDEQIAMHKDYYDKAKEVVLEILNKNSEITLAEFRDATGSSRKYCMAILENFDKNKITERVGDKRILKNN